MRFWAVLIAIFALSTTQSPLPAAVKYRYAAVCGSDLYLLATDGRHKLLISHGGKDTSWDGLAVSPATGDIIAALQNDNEPLESRLYAVNPATGERRLVATGRGYGVPEPAVWLSPGVMLATASDKDGLDGGVYALNIRNGASRLIVPARHEELPYDQLLPDGPRNLVATLMDETGATWVSVCDVASGKRCWQTNPNEGMSGLTGLAWSADGTALFVSFCVKNDEFDDGPGGLWRFDAQTGKHYPWKYAKQEIDGVLSVPDQGVLAVGRGTEIECLRMTDGKLLFKLPESQLGGLIGLFSTGKGGLIFCGSSRIVETDLSGKKLLTWSTHGLSSDSVRFSSARNALMFGRVREDDVAAGVLDLKTGQVTKFAANDWRVEWLLHDITR